MGWSTRTSRHPAVPSNFYCVTAGPFRRLVRSGVGCGGREVGEGGDERRARTQGRRAGHSAHRADRRRRGGGPAGARRPCTAAAPPPAALSGSLSAAAAAAGSDGCHTNVARQLRPEVDGWAEELGGRQKEAARHLLRDLRRDQVARHAPCSPAPSSHIRSSEPGANGPAARRLPPAGRGAGCQHGLRTSRGGVAPSSARRNPRQQQGGCPPSRSGRSSSGSGLDRPF